LLMEFKGGNAANAIPRQAIAHVALLASDEQKFRASVAASVTALHEEFRITESKKEEKKDGQTTEPATIPCAIAIEVTSVSSISSTPCTQPATDRALDFVMAAPHGVLRMSAEVEGVVDTSINLAYATLLAEPASSSSSSDSKQKDGMELHWFGRSSSDAQMLHSERKLDALARLAGCEVTSRFNYFPGWQPDSRSKVLSHVLSAHSELFGSKPRVYAVHAGLECGLIQGRYPSIDCVSIGPQIDGAHTPDERLKINTVGDFYRWIVKTVESLADVPANASNTSTSTSASTSAK